MNNGMRHMRDPHFRVPTTEELLTQTTPASLHAPAVAVEPTNWREYFVAGAIALGSRFMTGEAVQLVLQARNPHSEN